MSDITKCDSKDCPIRETCYRYTAEANEYWQSYFTTPPLKDGKCEEYWDRSDTGPLKPIHKFNSGMGATLCHHCRVIITTDLTDDLFCEECLEKRNEMMKRIG